MDKHSSFLFDVIPNIKKILPSEPCRDQILTVESEAAEAISTFKSGSSDWQTASTAKTASVWPLRGMLFTSWTHEKILQILNSSNLCEKTFKATLEKKKHLIFQETQRRDTAAMNINLIRFCSKLNRIKHSCVHYTLTML